MKHSRWFYLEVLVLYIVFSASVTYPLWAAPVPESFSPIIKKAAKAVVVVRVFGPEKDDSAPRGIESLLPPDSPFIEKFSEKKKQADEAAIPVLLSNASGFVFDPSGYILTNHHVVDIKDVKKIDVIFQNGKRYQAKIVGTDKRADIAVLKIDGGKEILPFIDSHDSDLIETGDWVIAIGNPFGLGLSASVGIVSARYRMPDATNPIVYLQTDAAINVGNSGGALIGASGEFVGIVTSIISPDSGVSVGIGFAIPSNYALFAAHEIIAYGRFRRGWLGARIEKVGDGNEARLFVKKVLKESPADKGGVLEGDVFLAWDKIEIQSVRNFQEIFAFSPVGSTKLLTVLRGGLKIDLNIRIEESHRSY